MINLKRLAGKMTASEIIAAFKDTIKFVVPRKFFWGLNLSLKIVSDGAAFSGFYRYMLFTRAETGRSPVCYRNDVTKYYKRGIRPTNRIKGLIVTTVD